MTRGYSDETQQGYTMDTVMEEAQRCLLCLDAPCSAACPAGTDPARFIRSVRFRNLKGAAGDNPRKQCDQAAYVRESVRRNVTASRRAPAAELTARLILEASSGL